MGRIDGKKRTGRLGSTPPPPLQPRGGSPPGFHRVIRDSSRPFGNPGILLNPQNSRHVEFLFPREPSPVCPAGGWGRNADALFICASKRLQTMDLRTDVDRDAGALDQCATVQRLRRSRNSRALLVPAAPAMHFQAVGQIHRVTICRELRHTDQLIKLDHGGTDRQRSNDGPRPVARLYTLNALAGLSRPVRAGRPALSSPRARGRTWTTENSRGIREQPRPMSAE